MFRRFTLFFAALAALALAIPGPAPGADSTLRLVVDVPFPFFVRDVSMPAGTYTVKGGFYESLQIRLDAPAAGTASTASATTALFLTQRCEPRKGAPAKAAVVFRYHPSHGYFLGEVWANPEIGGHDVPRSRLERESVTSTYKTARRVVIYARR